jgi:hypothetical protein
VAEVPESLREDEKEDKATEPGLTEVERLNGRGREVWEHLSGGEKEEAARTFDRLDEDKQNELLRKLDRFDRSDLIEGFEVAIQRDAADGPQKKDQDAGRDRSRESPSRGRGSPPRGRGGRPR